MSKITIATATQGTEVILTSSKFGDSSRNPVYGGTQGKVKGKVVTIVPGRYIAVVWENGLLNHYDDECLETVPVAVVAPTIPSLSLKDAVEQVIATQFIATNASFSAYDVTSKVRREVNEGRFEITGKQVEDVNGIKTQRVGHDEVRGLVRDYMNAVSTYDRRFNGDYIVYQANATVAAPVVSTGSTAPAAPLALTFTPTGVKATGTPAATPSTVSSQKLVAYVTKGPATLKQIQSRFKVRGAPQPTVRDLASVAASAGLKLEVKTPYYASVVSQ